MLNYINIHLFVYQILNIIKIIVLIFILAIKIQIIYSIREIFLILFY